QARAARVTFSMRFLPRASAGAASTRFPGSRPTIHFAPSGTSTFIWTAANTALSRLDISRSFTLCSTLKPGGLPSALLTARQPNERRASRSGDRRRRLRRERVGAEAAGGRSHRDRARLVSLWLRRIRRAAWAPAADRGRRRSPQSGG